MTDTLEAIDTEVADTTPDTSGFLDRVMQEMGTAGEKGQSGQTVSVPITESTTPPAKPDPAAPARPEDAPPVPETPPADDLDEEGFTTKHKKNTFGYLKDLNRFRLDKITRDHETKIKELESKTGTYESRLQEYQAKLDAAEALKAQHEKDRQEQDEKTIADWRTPYSVEVDPDGIPVVRQRDAAFNKLQTALSFAVSGLHDDPGKVELMANKHAGVFAGIMEAMSKNARYPVSAHAQHLQAELAKDGISVEYGAALDAVKTLQRHVPDLQDYGQTLAVLNDIRERNEPDWQNKMAARQEAYRRSLATLTDVPEDAEEGDDAVFARVLKTAPELKAMLKEQSDRVSADITGPLPGKADARAVRAAPKKLHETAMRAARLPVAIEALRRAEKTEQELRSRISALETRIGDEGDAVPRGSSTPPPQVAQDDKRPFLERIQEIMK